MNFKQEYILPAELASEKGRMISYGLHPCLELLYIDIKSRRIPEFQIASKLDKKRFMSVNYSFRGKCELLLKNGEATFLDTEEYAIDYGTALTSNDIFYYPRAEYYGLELFLYPCRELDEALSLTSHKSSITTRLGERYDGRQEPFITKADARIVHTMQTIAEDIQTNPDRELLMLDVGRLLRILGEDREEAETARVYYSGSQVQIARQAMDILTADLSKRYSAAELARRFGISETCFKNYFRGVYGRGYSELLTEIRMKRAAEMLLESRLKIGQISDAVGFATQSRFARAFKAYYGMAPLEYKRTEHLKSMSGGEENGKAR